MKKQKSFEVGVMGQCQRLKMKYIYIEDLENMDLNCSKGCTKLTHTTTQYTGPSNGFPPPRGAGGTFGCYRRAKWGPFPLDKREHPCDVCCALFSSLVQESCWPCYNQSFFVDVIEVSRFFYDETSTGSTCFNRDTFLRCSLC